MNKNIFDLCIIGNGPAGMTASIYAARYKLNHVLVGNSPGGLMASSHKICNFPSRPDISGLDLTQKMMDQVSKLHVAQKFVSVNNITKENNIFNITLSNDEILKTKKILLATGTKHRHLDLDREKELTGKGISYCATCDAMFYKDKIVAVIGGSDSANTASLYLSQVAKKVYQIYRGDKLRGETSWIEQVKSNKKITVLYGTNITKLVGKDKLEQIVLDKKYDGARELTIDGLFVEIGSVPDRNITDSLSIKTDESGYIITSRDQKTSEKDIWAAGDITTNSNNFRQIVTACAEGAIAAEDIYKTVQVEK